MADAPDPPSARTAEPDVTREKRRFHRVTTRLRFRILPLKGQGRPWLQLEPGEVSYFYRPRPDELRESLRLLEAVPRKTANMSEGGIRLRLPDDDPDRQLCLDGRWARGPAVHVLLAFHEPGVNAVFHLPASVIRIDNLPWARFVALAFHRVPAGLQRHLESFVLSTERQRKRRRLLAYGEPDHAEMAERLGRLEAESTHEHPHRYRSGLRRKPGKRYFP